MQQTCCATIAVNPNCCTGVFQFLNFQNSIEPNVLTKKFLYYDVSAGLGAKYKLKEM